MHVLSKLNIINKIHTYLEIYVCVSYEIYKHLLQIFHFCYVFDLHSVLPRELNVNSKQLLNPHPLPRI